MCGIAGYFGNKEISEYKIKNTLSSIYHRGPDSNGYYSSLDKEGFNTYLLHTRLAILDLDKRSDQPFKIGNYVLTLNGEIYNYLELKKELIELGYFFETEGDTEVLAKVLIEWGLEGIKKLEGMWSFCWFNKSTNVLTLCRDRFGEKPLYYLEEKGSIYFGSEIKSICSLRDEKLKINKKQLYRYLINGYKSLYKQKDTFFEKVKEISPGEYKIFTPNDTKTKKYWDPIFQVQDDSISYKEAVHLAKIALEKSIELRLRADVPVAFFLSGGVDSNSLISIALKKFGYDVHGFTIMNTDKRYEEKDLINYSVNKLGIKHTAINISSDNFLEDIRKLINFHDAPIYTINYFAQWQLMKEVKKFGYKVTISGVGADELFSGYYDHHLAYLAQMNKNNYPRYLSALEDWEKNISSIVRNPFLKDPNYFIRNSNNRDHIYQDAEFFTSFLQVPFSEEFTERFYSEDLLRNRMANELFHEIVPVILHEDDLNAMYYSIENRSPFLDSELFNICQRIPSCHLIKQGMAKSILRDAVKEFAPEKVIYSKRKVGFNIPINDYFDFNNPKLVSEILSPSPIFEILDHTKISNMLKPGKLSNSFSKFIFNFINAKIFCEEFSL